MANRKRNNRLYFYANDKELEQIKGKIEKSGRTQQEYLLKSALNKKMTIVPRDEISKIMTELVRQGNNLNQIARKCNSGSLERVRIFEMAEEMENLWQQLSALIQKQA